MKWTNIFCYYRTDGFLWFRILGHGLVIKDINKYPLIFSERYGYTKYIKIGKYIVRYISPMKF